MPRAGQSGDLLDLHLVPFFGRCRMASIDARLIDKYNTEKRRQEHQYGTGYAASTMNNHSNVLSRVLLPGGRVCPDRAPAHDAAALDAQ